MFDEKWNFLLKLIGIVIGGTSALVGLVEIWDRIYRYDPLISFVLVVVILGALGALATTITISFVSRSIMWKKYGMIRLPLGLSHRDVKPWNRHYLTVTKEGHLKVQESKVIVNRSKERRIALSSTFHALRELTIDDLEMTTNGEIKGYKNLEKGGTRVDFISKDTVKKNEPYLHKLTWIYRNVYGADELNWYTLPATKDEGVHTINLVVEGMKISSYFGDIMRDDKVLKNTAETEEYLAKVKIAPKIEQPVRNSDNSVTWKIRAPREDRLHVLFFRYTK